ncbi:MAG: DUF4160 domain-containing protein [Vicinamibacterales bacterium]
MDERVLSWASKMPSLDSGDRRTLGRCRRFWSKVPTDHVERDAYRAKFWLSPVRLARSGGFGAAELLRLGRLVAEREALFLGAWNEHFTASE